MTRRKGAYKNWELILMTTIIASGIILYYGGVRIVIELSEVTQENTDILKNFMKKELYATDIVKQKELKE